MSKAKKQEEKAAEGNNMGLTTQTQAQVPAVAGPSLADWGHQPVNMKNIVIASILPQQPLSNFVTTGKAAMGDIMESTNGTKIGTISEGIEFVPFHYTENWIHFTLAPNETKKKFKAIEAVTPANENLPLEEVVNGVKILRDRVLQYFVLLPSELAKGIKRPYVLSFRRTSMKAGKKLYTTMYVTNPSNNRIPAATVCKLSGKITSNDKGTFVVLDVTEGRNSTPAEMQAAFEWFKTVSTGKNIEVDNSDLAQENQGGGGYAQAEGPAQF